MGNEKKYEWQEGDITEITNDNLICKDCQYKIKNKGGMCDMFPRGKPNCVYNSVCKLYEKQSNH